MPLDLLTRRLIALDAALKAAGIPVDGIALVGKAPPTVRVDYRPGATGPQKTAGAALVAAFDWSAPADATAQTQGARADATGLLGALNDREAVLFRAVVGVLVAEINALRQWTATFKAQTALATNLANLQTRVAAMPTLTDRTPAQAKTAILAAIAAGTVDT